MTKPPNRLGRGLSALIPAKADSQPAPLSAAPPTQSIVQEIACDRITPNARQPRTSFDDLPLEELAASIRANGVLQPIIVRPAATGRFELVAGERRWRASQMIGAATIPAIVRDMTDAEAIEVALLENLRREDLSPLERARAYQQYIDEFGVSTDELARKLSESRSNVANYLRLLKLSGEVLAMLGSGELSMGHARAIAAITDEQRQLALARMASRRNLSVRQLETLAQGEGPVASPKSTESPPMPLDRHLQNVERALSHALGVPVMLQPGKKKNTGRILISYQSLDDFDRVLERLGIRDHM